MPKIPSYKDLENLKNYNEIAIDEDFPQWEEFKLVYTPDEFLTVQVSNQGHDYIADLNFYVFSNKKIKTYVRYTIKYNEYMFDLFEHLEEVFTKAQDNVIQAIQDHNFSGLHQIFIQDYQDLMGFPTKFEMTSDVVYNS